MAFVYGVGHAAAMSTTRLTPERRRELTRTALLDAAVTVFVRRGFHAASLEEIAEEAGFTRGAIYSNFGGKDELFLAVFERYEQRMLERFAELLEHQAGDVDAMFEEVGQAWAEIVYPDRDWALLTTEFWLYAMRDPDAAEKLAAHWQALEARVAQMFEAWAAQVGGRLRLPAADLAAITIAANDGLVMQRFANPQAAREERFREFLTLLKGVVEFD